MEFFSFLLLLRMGNCVGSARPDLKQIGAQKFRSLVHQKQYYLLKLIYLDLSSRISQNQVNLENFLLFFQKNGYWGNRLFKQFDVGASNLITEEEFIKGIVKIFKTSEDQKIELLFKFFSGKGYKKQGVGFSQFLTMLYNYPKEDFKKILNDEEFFNRELRKNLIADNNKHKGRRLDSICFSDISNNSVSGTTFRIEENLHQVESDQIQNQLQSQILKQLYKKSKLKSTNFKIKVGEIYVEVTTSNIHHMVKKFAISIFKSYNINIRTGKLQYFQFKDWMQKHKQLYNNYYKGFHSEIWELDKNSLKPLFTYSNMEFQSHACIYLNQEKPKIVLVSLLRSILLVRDESDLNMPISIVCMDGLSANKKGFQMDKGWGIQITHRDQIYTAKRFYLKTQQLADKWMQCLKFYKGCSITMLYEMGQKIGVGKFSVVYNCKQNQTAQKFAIKVIQSSKLDEQARKLISHESSIMSILSHPMIVSYKQSIQTKTNIYIVTQLVQGKDMLQFVKDCHGLSQADAALIIKQIIIGVRYLHALGIVHRDLKPQNIMIECHHSNIKQVGKIKIIDFGFANYLESLKFLSPQESLAGTPNYIAPESLRMEPQITQKIDNFAIGSILYFALSGNHAFGGCKIHEVLQNTLKGTYQLNDKKWKQVSSEAKDLINKLLQNDPADRITLDEALTHPWFSKFPHKIQQLTKIQQNTMSFARRSG